MIRLDESTLSEQTLAIGRIFLASGWHFPPEFRVQQAFAIVSTLHILVDERNGKDEVSVEGVDHVGDHANCDGQGRVLEVRQLDVHRSELYTPSDLGVFSGRVLESKRIPVSRLQVFEMRVSIDWRAFEEPGGTNAA